MTPNFMNSSPPSLFNGGSSDQVDNDHHHHKFFGPYNNQPPASSASNYSCHLYFNSTHQDQAGYYHTEFYQPQQQLEGNNYAAYGGSYELENKKKHENQAAAEKINPEKWMSSKMRLKNNSDQKGVEKTRNNIVKRSSEDHQKQPTSSMETDQSSNSSSNNGNTLIRVCSDCNTTKTPLWRSGPKGPKTLCNACGIRQRKARRAMAEAAAAAAAANGTIQLQPEVPTVKIKVHHKEKSTKTNNNNGPVSTVPFKKRCKVIVGSSSHQEPKKLGFEDYLINLSKKLAFQNMFPQDEKEAAILLMALSCGLVHS